MISNNKPFICPGCPRGGEACDAIVNTESQTLRADFASLIDDPSNRRVEAGVIFADANGNKSDLFPPHTTAEDIAQCSQPVVKRFGFLGRKVLMTCGTAVEFEASLAAAAQRREAASDISRASQRFLSRTERDELRRRMDAGEDFSDMID